LPADWRLGVLDDEGSFIPFGQPAVKVRSLPFRGAASSESLFYTMSGQEVADSIVQDMVRAGVMQGLYCRQQTEQAV